MVQILTVRLVDVRRTFGSWIGLDWFGVCHSHDHDHDHDHNHEFQPKSQREPPAHAEINQPDNSKSLPNYSVQRRVESVVLLVAVGVVVAYLGY